jgi:hypothetical protein
MRVAFGVFLVLHALVHSVWLVPPPDDPKYPFTLDSSRVLSGATAGTLRAIGLTLVVTALVAFLLAGLGVLGVAGLSSVWRIAAGAGAMASLALVIVFWNSYFVAGPLLNAGVLVAAFTDWPQP